MSHRIWRESKPQPSRARSGNLHIRQSNQLLLNLPPFPVRHPADVHCSLTEKVLKIKSNKTGLLIVRFLTEHLLLFYIPLICYMLTDFLKLIFILYNLYSIQMVNFLTTVRS